MDGEWDNVTYKETIMNFEHTCQFRERQGHQTYGNGQNVCAELRSLKMTLGKRWHSISLDSFVHTTIRRSAYLRPPPRGTLLERTQVQRHTTPSTCSISPLLPHELPRLWKVLLIYPLPPWILYDYATPRSSSIHSRRSHGIGPRWTSVIGPSSIWLQGKRAHIEHRSQPGHRARVRAPIGWGRRW